MEELGADQHPLGMRELCHLRQSGDQVIRVDADLIGKAFPFGSDIGRFQDHRAHATAGDTLHVREEPRGDSAFAIRVVAHHRCHHQPVLCLARADAARRE